ncbi:hypothetical protein Gasu2_33800 [Galdieria sulphuraria]|nr:hypothetical protein Gasu2_33800 [Galdieria sulphuraria]
MTGFPPTPVEGQGSTNQDVSQANENSDGIYSRTRSQTAKQSSLNAQTGTTNRTSVDEGGPSGTTNGKGSRGTSKSRRRSKSQPPNNNDENQPVSRDELLNHVNGLGDRVEKFEETQNRLVQCCQDFYRLKKQFEDFEKSQANLNSSFRECCLNFHQFKESFEKRKKRLRVSFGTSPPTSPHSNDNGQPNHQGDFENERGGEQMDEENAVPEQGGDQMQDDNAPPAPSGGGVPMDDAGNPNQQREQIDEFNDCIRDIPPGYNEVFAENLRQFLVNQNQPELHMMPEEEALIYGEDNKRVAQCFLGIRNDRRLVVNAWERANDYIHIVDFLEARELNNLVNRSQAFREQVNNSYNQEIQRYPQLNRVFLRAAELALNDGDSAKIEPFIKDNSNHLGPPNLRNVGEILEATTLQKEQNISWESFLQDSATRSWKNFISHSLLEPTPFEIWLLGSQLFKMNMEEVGSPSHAKLPNLEGINLSLDEKAAVLEEFAKLQTNDLARIRLAAAVFTACHKNQRYISVSEVCESLKIHQSQRYRVAELADPGPAEERVFRWIGKLCKNKKKQVEAKEMYLKELKENVSLLDRPAHEVAKRILSQIEN